MLKPPKFMFSYPSRCMIMVVILLTRLAAVIRELVITLASHSEGWVFKTQMRETQMTAAMLYPRQLVWVSRVLGDDHYKQINKTCSPSPLMVTSFYEWKMLEWDKKKTNNQTKIYYTYCIGLFIVYCLDLFSFLTPFSLCKSFLTFTCLEIFIFSFLILISMYLAICIMYTLTL